ncbi:MAG: sulfite oxidase [Actinomycetota bacterium]
MSFRDTKAGIAGAAGMVVALGVTELVHGLYGLVPSVLVSVAQGVVEYTPGEIVTAGIELLGSADIPILISGTIVLTLLFAALLGTLAVRHPSLALFGTVILGVIALAACFAGPSVSPIPTIATIVGALILGAGVSEALLRFAGLREAAGEPAPDGPEAPRSPVVRSRGAHSGSGISVNRSGFIAVSGAAAIAGLAAAGVGRLLAGGSSGAVSAPKPLRLPAEPKRSGREGVEKAPRHKVLSPPPKDASLDIPGMPALITPAEDFYLIDTALSSPRIDASEWRLSVKGAVANPIEVSYRDLLSMPTREADITLACVSNEVGGDLVSNGRWTGVLLSDVLAEAGVSRGSIPRGGGQLVGRSMDGWTSGFKTELALDGREALLAFGLNGSELPLKHGYPVRLVVPGLYGYVSATKWLAELELKGWDFDAYWIQRSWSKRGPIKTQSRIDTISDGQILPAGKVPIGGVAWAPHRGISGVEVSTDGGESWNPARLARQLDVDTWRQYVYDWNATPGEYTLKVRATDGEGNTQTADESPPHPSGATGYHTVSVRVS